MLLPWLRSPLLTQPLASQALTLGALPRPRDLRLARVPLAVMVANLHLPVPPTHRNTSTCWEMCNRSEPTNDHWMKIGQSPRGSTPRALPLLVSALHKASNPPSRGLLAKSTLLSLTACGSPLMTLESNSMRRCNRPISASMTMMDSLDNFRALSTSRTRWSMIRKLGSRHSSVRFNNSDRISERRHRTSMHSRRLSLMLLMPVMCLIQHSTGPLMPQSSSLAPIPIGSPKMRSPQWSGAGYEASSRTHNGESLAQLRAPNGLY
eukprot:6760188-Karenia_brevis.AAC.1